MSEEEIKSLLHPGCWVKVSHGPDFADRGCFYQVVALHSHQAAVVYPYSGELISQYHGWPLDESTSDDDDIKSIKRFIKHNGTHGIFWTSFRYIKNIKYYSSVIPNYSWC